MPYYTNATLFLQRSHTPLLFRGDKTWYNSSTISFVKERTL